MTVFVAKYFKNTSVSKTVSRFVRQVAASVVLKPSFKMSNRPSTSEKSASSSLVFFTYSSSSYVPVAKVAASPSGLYKLPSSSENCVSKTVSSTSSTSSRSSSVWVPAPAETGQPVSRQSNPVARCWSIPLHLILSPLPSGNGAEHRSTVPHRGIPDSQSRVSPIAQFRPWIKLGA